MTLFLKFTTNLRTHFTKVLQSTSERPNKPDLYHEYTENGSHANDIQNLAEGREMLKTQVRTTGCMQRCTRSLLQSFTFSALDLDDVGCAPEGHLQPSDKMPKVLPCSFPSKFS